MTRYLQNWIQSILISKSDFLGQALHHPDNIVSVFGMISDFMISLKNIFNSIQYISRYKRPTNMYHTSIKWELSHDHAGTFKFDLRLLLFELRRFKQVSLISWQSLCILSSL